MDTFLGQNDWIFTLYKIKILYIICIIPKEKEEK